MNRVAQETTGTRDPAEVGNPDSGPVPPPTRDSLLDGRLTLFQPARGHGYRFNLDPVLLAGFVGPAGRVVDLGAGVGVLGLLLLAKGKAREVTLVERQLELAGLAADNCDANGFADRCRVLPTDLRDLFESGTADLVVANPPYFGSSGRGAKDVGRDLGRHERHGGLADFVRVAAQLATPAGRIAFVIPATRGAELLLLLDGEGFVAQRTRTVTSRVEVTPHLWLVEAGRSKVTRQAPEPPLVIHTGSGRQYTAEVESYLAP